MSDPALSPRARHRDVVAQLRRDLEREGADRHDPLAVAITLSAIELALDNAAVAGDWHGVQAATADRLRSIDLDEATVTAWANELVRAAGGPTPAATLHRGRRWRRRQR